MNHTLTVIVFTAFLQASFVSQAEPAGIAKDKLFEQFTNPPDAAKPSCYWWWLNANVDKEAITRDMGEFSAKGIGSVLLVCSGNWGGSNNALGPAFLSNEWRELFKFALKEASRVGIKVDVNLAPGWNMGGPWVTPDKACRWFLQSEMNVKGPQKYSGKLPLPGVKDGYDSPAQLMVNHSMGFAFENVDYRDTAVVAFRTPPGKRPAARADLPAKSNRLDANCFIRSEQAMSQTLLPWIASPDDQPVCAKDVVDLTSRMKADGTLEWDVPEGEWTILRTGHRMTGAPLSVPMRGQGGLENDYFDRAGVDLMFESVGKVLIEDAGPLAGTTLRGFAEDSFEAGYPNWTENMLKHFKRYRGYDPTPFLPVFKGWIVGNADISERFLHDYRKTVADCFADEHYGRFEELCRQHNMVTRCESAGPSWSGTVCMDGLKNLGRTAFPQGEFWQDGTFVENGQNKVTKMAASAAHIYGKRYVAAEALTSGGVGARWDAAPSNFKPMVNRAFCEGINQCVFHTMTCQKPSEGKPGLEYGAGQHFNPNVTWWNQTAGPWISYINRCQAMLQSGLFVADVLYYNGDWAPNLVGPKQVAPPGLGKGYDYDVCNAEVLLTRLSVKDGRITLPDGMSYRILILPESKRMPVEVVRKIEELVRAGATIVGPKPESDPGFKNYPECDAKVKKIAAEIWGDLDGTSRTERRFGKGRVIWGKTPREVLMASGIKPDFVINDGGEPPVSVWIWHTEDGKDLAPTWKRFFKTEVPLPATANILSATLDITADDKFVVEVNNSQVAQGDDWRTVYSSDLSKQLHAGNNQIRVTAENAASSPAGVLARLTIRLADGTTIVCRSDKNWLSSRDGTTWAPALEIGAFGCAPWHVPQSQSKSRWGIPQPDIDFIHRTADGAEIYFLANRNSRAEAVEATFRVSGRRPELWDPVSGQRRDLPVFESKDSCITVPLEFEPDGSMFVVFRKETGNLKLETGGLKKNFLEFKSVQEITGPWTVQFDPQWFYPADGLSGDQSKGLMNFDKLEDWSKRTEPAVKYFGGTAVYRKVFDVAPETSNPLSVSTDLSPRLFLDLGTVKETARVKLNGKDLGVVWCHPWRVDVTGVIKSGENTLEIEVVNNWYNRLVGDAGLPEAERRTRTNIGDTNKDAAPMQSGLLGPVIVMKNVEKK